MGSRRAPGVKAGLSGKKNVVLIGMPGAGKSTVGVVLAKNLGRRFLDSDLVIQEKTGKLLHEIISEEGLEGFLAIENEVDTPLSTAFGVNQTPTWDDLQTFLEDRCIPQQRDGLSYYLEELGLDHYDPLAIIRKTQGRMAEDTCWIKIVEG